MQELEEPSAADPEAAGDLATEAEANPASPFPEPHPSASDTPAPEPAALKRQRRLPAFLHRRTTWSGAAMAGSIAVLAITVASALPDDRGGARAVALPVQGPMTFQILPEFVADLKSLKARRHYVQLEAVVELHEELVSKLTAAQAPIVADVQARLRDFAPVELGGSAGIERLRGDVLGIVNTHLAPERAKTVLFTKFLVD